MTSAVARTVEIKACQESERLRSIETMVRIDDCLLPSLRRGRDAIAASHPAVVVDSPGSPAVEPWSVQTSEP